MSFSQILSALAIFTVAFSGSTFAWDQKASGVASEPRSEVWSPADESDWAVFMDAPSYHFNLAKEYLQKGEAAKAADELKLGNSFLTYQMNRISFAAKQIDKLAKAIKDGKETNIARVDSITTSAINIITFKYAMVPLEIESTPVFENGYKYHFEKAKEKLQENNPAMAAAEIRKAASFLRLRSAQLGIVAKDDLDSAKNKLKELADNVESGSVKSVKDLERDFQKAIAAISKKKEKK